METTDRRILLQRGNLTGTGGAQAAPGNGATITILDSSLQTQWITGLTPDRVQLNIFSSHDSGASGVTFESSFDRGANWRSQSAQTYTNASGATTYDYLMKGGHVRIKYVNSANVLTAWEMEVFAIYDRNPGS